MMGPTLILFLLVIVYLAGFEYITATAKEAKRDATPRETVLAATLWPILLLTLLLRKLFTP